MCKRADLMTAAKALGVPGVRSTALKADVAQALAKAVCDGGMPMDFVFKDTPQAL
jgi:hypothetical protein